MSAKIPAFSDIGKSTKGTTPSMHMLAYVSTVKICEKDFAFVRDQHRPSIHMSPGSHMMFTACVLADLLYGGGNTGAFQFNNVLNLSSTTADGVVSAVASSSM